MAKNVGDVLSRFGLVPELLLEVFALHLEMEGSCFMKFVLSMFYLQRVLCQVDSSHLD